MRLQTACSKSVHFELHTALQLASDRPVPATAVLLCRYETPQPPDQSTRSVFTAISQSVRMHQESRRRFNQSLFKTVSIIIVPDAGRSFLVPGVLKPTPARRSPPIPSLLHEQGNFSAWDLRTTISVLSPDTPALVASRPDYHRVRWLCIGSRRCRPITESSIRWSSLSPSRSFVT